MVGGFYALPYYICPGHYVYESLVSAIFHQDSRSVVSNIGSEYHDYLLSNGVCVNPDVPCVGTMHDYVQVFFGGLYTRDHQMRNALVLGLILALTRVLTWLALKYIRFST